MFALLNPRFLIGLVLVAALAFTHFTAYRKGKHVVLTEWQLSVAAANEESRRLERARQSKADDAARIAAARERGIAAAADSARRESAGLRDDINAAIHYAAQSRAAAEQTARLTSDLLGRCEARYLGVAEAAARADSEARELRQGWPK
jgi:hypothetical protein